MCRVRFESFVQQMDERWFERIHRSYLAAYRHIRYIRRYEVEMDNGEIIPLSKKSVCRIPMSGSYAICNDQIRFMERRITGRY